MTLNRPDFAGGDLAFCYLALVVFLVFAALSSISAGRPAGSPSGRCGTAKPPSRTLGVSVVQVKVIVGALGCFVAGVGGAFLAMDVGVAQPVILRDIRRPGLARRRGHPGRPVHRRCRHRRAGLRPPARRVPDLCARPWAEVPAILFGLGAISVARDPDGIVVKTGHQLRQLITLLWSAPHRGAEAVANGSSGTAVLPGHRVLGHRVLRPCLLRPRSRIISGRRTPASSLL